MRWDEEIKTPFDICLVWYVSIVEGAISETSKVWQLDMFEQKSKREATVVCCASKTVLKTVSRSLSLSIEEPFLFLALCLSRVRVVAARSSSSLSASPGTQPNLRKNGTRVHPIVNLRRCKKDALLPPLPFRQIERFGETAIYDDTCCATASHSHCAVLKGLWPTQTGFRSNFLCFFLRAKCCATIRSTTVQEVCNSKTCWLGTFGAFVR